MQVEVEAKFLNIDHGKMRNALERAGAKCEHPMRLMKRAMLDYPDGRFQANEHRKRLRVRDEGDKIVINFKAKNDTNYVHEIETEVESFDKMIQLLEAIGLEVYSRQESKRETWHYKNVEVVLDEWPWLDAYIEIEGPSEKAIQTAASDLGFDWKDAKFGSVDTAYRQKYPGMTKNESIGDLKDVKFGDALPEYLAKRMKKNGQSI